LSLVEMFSRTFHYFVTMKIFLERPFILFGKNTKTNA